MLQTGAVAQSRTARAADGRVLRRTGLLLRHAKSDYQGREPVRKRGGRGGHGVDLSHYRRVQTGKGHDTTKGSLYYYILCTVYLIIIVDFAPLSITRITK